MRIVYAYVLILVISDSKSSFGILILKTSKYISYFNSWAYLSKIWHKDRKKFIRGLLSKKLYFKMIAEVICNIQNIQVSFANGLSGCGKPIIVND